MNKTIFLERLENYMFSTVGRSLDQATDKQVYTALSFMVREMLSRHRNEQSYDSSKKILYTLSFEYLPGKQLRKNLLYLGIEDLAYDALKEKGYHIESIYESEQNIAIGYAGLGILSDSYLDSASNLGIQSMGYGLRYNHPFLSGSVGKKGKTRTYDTLWEYPADISYPVRFRDFSVNADAYDILYLGYGKTTVNSLRLWKSTSNKMIDFDEFNEGNLKQAYDDYLHSKAITEFIYPDGEKESGRRIRLMQEYFYASASIQDILARHINAGLNIQQLSSYIRIDINDAHPVLSIAELIYRLNVLYGIGFNSCMNIVRNTFSYTNYSLLDDSFEFWDMQLIASLIPHIYEVLKTIDQIMKAESGTSIDPNSGIFYHGKLDTVRMLSYLSKHIFALSSTHEQMLKKSSRHSFQLNIDSKVRLKEAGISDRRWLWESNHRLYHVLRQKDKADYDISLIDEFDLKESFIQPEIARVKQKNKSKLADKIRYRTGLEINPYSIFDVQIKRYHEFKRHLLNALRIALMYYLLKEDANRYIVPRTYIFSGVAPKNYLAATEIVKFIRALGEMINKDRFIKDKIKLITMDPTSTSDIQDIIVAADVEESLALAGVECSGINTLKTLMNGAITIGTPYGVNEKVYQIVGDEGFIRFGLSSEEVDHIRSNHLYDMKNYIRSNEMLHYVVTMLQNSSGKELNYDFNTLYQLLAKYNDGFFVFRDFNSYCEAHDQIDAIYLDTDDWNQRIYNNIKASKHFTEDRLYRKFLDIVME